MKIYYIYNPKKGGFLRVKHVQKQRRRGYKGFASSKEMVFERWGPMGDGEMYVVNNETVDSVKLFRDQLEKLKIPDLRFRDLYIIPLEEGKGGHCPDFVQSFSLAEHWTVLLEDMV